jgi:hypothetical protein
VAGYIYTGRKETDQRVDEHAKIYRLKATESGSRVRECGRLYILREKGNRSQIMGISNQNLGCEI